MTGWGLNRVTALILALVVIPSAAWFALYPPQATGVWTHGFDRFVGFALVAACSALVIAAPSILRRSHALSVLLASTYLVFFLNPAAMFAVFVLLFAALTLGFALLFRLKDSVIPNGEELPGHWTQLVLALGTGLALISLIVWGLSHFAVNTARIHFAVYGFLSLGSLWGLKAGGRQALRQTLTNAARDVMRPPSSVFSLAVLFMACLLIAYASLPEMGSDSIAAYHAYFAHLKTHGVWHHDPALALWAFQPLGGLHQAGSVYLLGGEPAARLLNLVWFGIAAGGAAIAAARIAGAPSAGWIAAALMLSIPDALNNTGFFFYDNAVAMWISLAGLALFSVRQGANTTSYCVLAFAICLAGAAATKFSAWILSVFLFLAMAWTLRSSLGAIVRLTVVTSLSFIVLLVPVVLFTWLQTGNPLFPYYNHIFESPYRSPVQHGSPHEGYVHWDMLFRAVFNTRTFSFSDQNGAVGLVLMLVPPAMIVGALASNLRRSTLIPLILLVLSAVTLSALQNDLRLIGAVVPLMVAGAVGIIWAVFQNKDWSAFVATVLAGLVFLVHVFLLPTGSFIIPALPVSALWSPTGHQTIIDRYNPSRAVNAYLDTKVGADSRRFYIGARIGDSDATNFTDSWYTESYALDLRQAREPDEIVAYLTDLGVDAVILGPIQSRNFLSDAFESTLVNSGAELAGFPNQQVFVMPMAISHGHAPWLPPRIEAIIEQSQTDEGARLGRREMLSLRRIRTAPPTSGFRTQFEISCRRGTQISISIVSLAGEDRSRHMQFWSPCMGEGLSTPFDLRIPLADDRLPEQVQVWMRLSEDGEFVLSNFEAGFKPVFETCMMPHCQGDDDARTDPVP